MGAAVAPRRPEAEDRWAAAAAAARQEAEEAVLRAAEVHRAASCAATEGQARRTPGSLG